MYTICRSGGLQLDPNVQCRSGSGQHDDMQQYPVPVSDRTVYPSILAMQLNPQLSRWFRRDWLHGWVSIINKLSSSTGEFLHWESY
jgi:hypothetical protein